MRRDTSNSSNGQHRHRGRTVGVVVGGVPHYRYEAMKLILVVAMVSTMALLFHMRFLGRLMSQHEFILHSDEATATATSTTAVHHTTSEARQLSRHEQDDESSHITSSKAAKLLDASNRRAASSSLGSGGEGKRPADNLPSSSKLGRTLETTAGTRSIPLTKMKQLPQGQLARYKRKDKWLESESSELTKQQQKRLEGLKKKLASKEESTITTKQEEDDIIHAATTLAEKQLRHEQTESETPKDEEVITRKQQERIAQLKRMVAAKREARSEKEKTIETAEESNSAPDKQESAQDEEKMTKRQRKRIEHLKSLAAEKARAGEEKVADESPEDRAEPGQGAATMTNRQRKRIEHLKNLAAEKARLGEEQVAEEEAPEEQEEPKQQEATTTRLQRKRIERLKNLAAEKASEKYGSQSSEGSPAPAIDSADNAATNGKEQTEQQESPLTKTQRKRIEHLKSLASEKATTLESTGTAKTDGGDENNGQPHQDDKQQPSPVESSSEQVLSEKDQKRIDRLRNRIVGKDGSRQGDESTKDDQPPLQGDDTSTATPVEETSGQTRAEKDQLRIERLRNRIAKKDGSRQHGDESMKDEADQPPRHDVASTGNPVEAHDAAPESAQKQQQLTAHEQNRIDRLRNRIKPAAHPQENFVDAGSAQEETPAEAHDEPDEQSPEKHQRLTAHEQNRIDRLRNRIKAAAHPQENAVEAGKEQSAQEETGGDEEKPTISVPAGTKGEEPGSAPRALNGQELKRIERLRNRSGKTGIAGEDLQFEQPRPRDKGLFISYALHRGGSKPFENKFSLYTTCPVVPGDKSRLELPNEMRQAPGVFDFTTTITTNLKMLIMGDSVGLQVSQGLEEAADAAWKWENRSIASHRDRAVLRWTRKGTHEGLHVSAPVRGGGAIAGWRITGLFRRDAEDQKLPNAGGGGWKRVDAHNLLAHPYSTDLTMPSKPISALDVVIYRVPHPWSPWSQITVEALEETVQLASELFGATKFVFMTIPINNNVWTRDDLVQLEEKNAMIRNFASSWPDHVGRSNVTSIQVLDLAQLTQPLVEWNAKTLGYNTAVSDTFHYFLRYRMCKPTKRKLCPSIPQLCGAIPKPPQPEDAWDCKRNSITKDGMHWCMETVGGRVMAGLACILDCMYSKSGDERKSSLRRHEVQACSQSCNDRYMSLRPIPFNKTAADATVVYPQADPVLVREHKDLSARALSRIRNAAAVSH